MKAILLIDRYIFLVNFSRIQLYHYFHHLEFLTVWSIDLLNLKVNEHCFLYQQLYLCLEKYGQSSSPDLEIHFFFDYETFSLITHNLLIRWLEAWVFKQKIPSFVPFYYL